VQGLALLGWTIGRNVRIDTRWATSNAAEVRRHAAELAALAPDVILAHGASSVALLLQMTRTVPIVFPTAVDPVGAGIVDSLARPGGNATGFSGLDRPYLPALFWPPRALTKTSALKTASMPMKKLSRVQMELSKPAAYTGQ
jgi:hypothetical protein